MQVSKKMDKWDGVKKSFVRALKIQAVVSAKKAGLIGNNTGAITLAGAKAHFEVALSNKKLIKSENIVTIQCPTKPTHKVGSKVLRNLLKIRDKQLPGMHVWPSTFNSFCDGYHEGKVVIPSVSIGKKKTPYWHSTTTFRAEMYKFIDFAVKDISVADIDLCGIFSKENARSAVALMDKDALADTGVMFINHQKGRDGQCVSMLQEYFKFDKHFNIDDVHRYWGDPITLTLKDKTKEEKKELFYLIRYVLVPIYYTIKAFEAGYCLEIEKLVEYRDKNSDSGVGVNMLQWMFIFRKRESTSVSLSGNFKEYLAASTKETDLLKYQLKLLASESYQYSSYID